MSASSPAIPPSPHRSHRPGDPGTMSRGLRATGERSRDPRTGTVTPIGFGDPPTHRFRSHHVHPFVHLFDYTTFPQRSKAIPPQKNIRGIDVPSSGPLMDNSGRYFTAADRASARSAIRVEVPISPLQARKQGGIDQAFRGLLPKGYSSKRPVSGPRTGRDPDSGPKFGLIFLPRFYRFIILLESASLQQFT